MQLAIAIYESDIIKQRGKSNGYAGFSIGGVNIASFFMGILFQVDWIDSHGTAMNNLWIWFAFGMLAFVIIGVVLEIISKVLKRNL
ncbi:MAG: hypothetical protein PHY15_04950 [Eubacteriales bacterium]|nr:hypothetical protein [Eubacteriales bacterium]MDD4474228.1 hypothetical protein [Eubacteriales bacterium]